MAEADAVNFINEPTRAVNCRPILLNSAHRCSWWWRWLIILSQCVDRCECELCGDRPAEWGARELCSSKLVQMKLWLQMQVNRSVIVVVIIIFVVIGLPLNTTKALKQTLHAEWNGMWHSVLIRLICRYFLAWNDNGLWLSAFAKYVISVVVKQPTELNYI